MNGLPSSWGHISLPKNSLDANQETKQEIPSENCIRKQATKRLQETLLKRIFSVGKPDIDRINRVSYPFSCSWSNEPSKQEPAPKSLQAENSTHEQITQRLQEKLLQQMLNVNRSGVNRVYQPTYPLGRSTSIETEEQECSSKSIQVEAQQIILNKIVSSGGTLEQILKFRPPRQESSKSCGNGLEMQDPLKLEANLEQSVNEKPHILHDTPLKVNDGSFKGEKELSLDVVTGIDDDSKRVKTEIKSEGRSDVEERKCCFNYVDVAPNWKYESSEDLLPSNTEVASSERENINEEKLKETNVKPFIILERDIHNTTLNRAHDTVISIKTMSKVPHEFVGKLPESANVFQLSSSGNEKNKRLLLFGCEMATCPECKVVFNNVRNFRVHFSHVHREIAVLKFLKQEKQRRVFSHIVRASKVRERLEIDEPEVVGRENTFSECSTDQRESKRTTRRLFRLNFKMQKNYQPSLFLCTVCGKGYGTLQILRTHLRTHDARIREYTCHFCGKSYLTNGSLTNHIKNFHNMQSHRCLECNRECTTESGLQVHIRLKHATSYQFVCHICGEQLARSDYLRRHLKRHHLPGGHSKYARSGAPKKQRPACCKYCSKVYPNLIYLRIHLLTHVKSLRYKCQFCSFTFSCLQSQLRHQKRHEDPNYKLSCTICWHKMKTKEALEKHLKVHERSKKYACRTCGATFPSKYLLNHHRVEHVSEAEALEERKVILKEGLRNVY